MTSQLGAQFGFSIGSPSSGQFGFFPSDNVLDTSNRQIVIPPGTIRLAQSLYITIKATNEAPVDRQVWIMPWWLHPTFEFRYPGQNGYTLQDQQLFGPQVIVIANQDSLWMTSPKRLDIVGAPSPPGTSLSEMQSDIWAIDVPANTTVKKSFFYPSHGYGLAYTGQIYSVPPPSPFSPRVVGLISVTPGALHSVFQDSQG